MRPKTDKRHTRRIDPDPWESRVVDLIKKYRAKDNFNPVLGAQILGMASYLVNDTICRMFDEDDVRGINFSEYMPGTYAHFLTDLIDLIQDAQQENFPLFLVGSFLEWEKFKMQTEVHQLYTAFRDRMKQQNNAMQGSKHEH